MIHMVNAKFRNRPKHRFIVTATSLLVASALVLGITPDITSETAASWTDQSASSGSFQATSIGTFDSVECEEIRGGLLGLFTDEIVLSWEAPSGVSSFPEGKINYVVEWGSTLSVGGPAAGGITTSNLNYHIDADVLVGVGLPLAVAVTPVLVGSDWAGPTKIIPITQVSLLGGNLIMKCGSLLSL